jgi:hypothetical protein
MAAVGAAAFRHGQRDQPKKFDYVGIELRPAAEINCNAAATICSLF